MIGAGALRRLPVLGALLIAAACTGVPDGVEPVSPFSAERYQGRWYEIMRLDHSFERGLTNVTATYGLRDDGTVSVVNRGFDPEECAFDEVEGTAEFQGDPDTASLSVTFFWPFAGGYHVFALDQQDYQWAVVSGPTRDYLWILARSPDMDEDLRNRLVGEAAARDLPVGELILVDHGDTACDATG